MTASFFDEIGAAADPQWEVVPEPAHRPLPAIPEPSTTPVPALLDACTAVAVWAEQCDDVEEVREVYDRMAAVAAYLSRQDHAAAAAATLRRLEVRIGELAPAEPPGDRRSEAFRSRVSDLNLPKQRVAEFRQMAEHAEVVDEVIEDSTEESPASRRKVLAAIKNLEDVAKGETRPAPEPRRNRLVPRAGSAAWDLRNAVEALEEIAQDDRFRSHLDEIPALWVDHLTYTMTACKALLEKLENP